MDGDDNDGDDERTLINIPKPSNLRVDKDIYAGRSGIDMAISGVQLGNPTKLGRTREH